MSSLPVKEVGLLLGNDLAGDQVFSSPIVSSVFCEVPTMVALEKEYPEVFSACSVTKPEIRQEVEVDGTPQSEESIVDLGDTLFSPLFGGASSKKFSRVALVEAQKSDPGLGLL